MRNTHGSTISLCKAIAIHYGLHTDINGLLLFFTPALYSLHQTSESDGLDGNRAPVCRQNYYLEIYTYKLWITTVLSLFMLCVVTLSRGNVITDYTGVKLAAVSVRNLCVSFVYVPCCGGGGGGNDNSQSSAGRGRGRHQ